MKRAVLWPQQGPELLHEVARRSSTTQAKAQAKAQATAQAKAREKAQPKAQVQAKAQLHHSSHTHADAECHRQPRTALHCTGDTHPPGTAAPPSTRPCPGCQRKMPAGGAGDRAGAKARQGRKAQAAFRHAGAAQHCGCEEYTQHWLAPRCPTVQPTRWLAGARCTCEERPRNAPACSALMPLRAFAAASSASSRRSSARASSCCCCGGGAPLPSCARTASCRRRRSAAGRVQRGRKVQGVGWWLWQAHVQGRRGGHPVLIWARPGCRHCRQPRCHDYNCISTPHLACCYGFCIQVAQSCCSGRHWPCCRWCWSGGTWRAASKLERLQTQCCLPG